MRRDHWQTRQTLSANESTNPVPSMLTGRQHEELSNMPRTNRRLKRERWAVRRNQARRRYS